jgi:NADH-quinone oxidoreductase subunit C
MKQPEEIAAYLKEKIGEGILEFVPAEVGQPWITLAPDSIKKIAKFLRDDSELRFNTLMCLSGVHYPAEQELGVTYHLHSTTFGHTVALKVRVPIENPRVQSVESVWKTADWHEREAWDMLGIIFDGHPNMARILCPDDWEGHPLRKDYVQQETYLGITTRN